MTLVQVGAILGVHPRTIKKWAKAGKLPYVLIGKLYRIKHSDFLKFVTTTE